MTTLYKPVLIESAEQAEALPPGTVTISCGEQGQVIEAAIRVRNGWHVTGAGKPDGDPSLFTHRDIVGDTALVPIEAEEEHGARGDGEAEDFYLTRRYTTPWEAE